MKIAIVGSGYVGLVAAACFAELGHDVVCIDNDQRKLAALRAGECVIHEQHLPELLARHRGGRLTFSDALHQAVQECSVVFIAVGTPAAESGEADLSYVEAVSREIGHALNGEKIIVEKSTVPVYTCEWIRRVVSMTSRAGCNFDVVSNPEFLREGTAVVDFLCPDRIVVGADSSRAAEVLRELYRPLTSGDYHRRPDAMVRPKSAAPPVLVVTSSKSAELIKHASNAFLALKISFINAVANICEAVGADVEQVCEGVGRDSRIGPKFLRPGIGYGGSCFPKDVSAFAAVAHAYGYEFGLLGEVMKINDEQRTRFVSKVKSALWNLRGKRLGVLGLAFKGGTDDIRESPAIQIIRTLLREGCHITAFDPAATARAEEALGAGVRYAADAYAAAAEADALLILTDWPEFAQLDLPKLRPLMKQPLIIDGRNLYSPEAMAAAGFSYLSVGRQQVVATQLDRRRAATASPLAEPAEVGVRK